MAYDHRGDAPVYAPNSEDRGYADNVGEVEEGWETDGAMVRQAYTLRAFDYWKSVDTETGKQIEELVRAGLGAENPGGDADDAKVVEEPIVESATNAAH
ncbi:hypothetical protein GCM10009721_36910 [Terrabacter tumescens]|uniref:Uncharacterized protein n=1 Tax=Terrabacter tumescens TaxID=60443 RepID=A0ABQ2IEN7_9MICO|nr:hypothetical protein [Terrabacter tumescens]GGN06003.1 hypothetical protein GCM10009721_36910 [Terrabacter tumescens]